MMLDDAVHHRQTETGSFLAFGGKKRLKTIPAHFFGHANAGIADFKEDKFAFHASAQRQGAALRHGIHGIENEVGDRITQPAAISQDDWNVLEINDHTDLAARTERLSIPFRPGERDGLFDEPTQINRLMHFSGIARS